MIINGAIGAKFIMSPSSFSFMSCNRCGFTDTSYKPDLSQFDLLENTEAAINFVKKHFEELGWQTSWGYDLCPKCVAQVKAQHVRQAAK